MLCLILRVGMKGLRPGWASPRYARFLILGFFFSMVGDVFLSLPETPVTPFSSHLFQLGLGGFLVAHLCYMTALSSMSFPRDLRHEPGLRELLLDNHANNNNRRESATNAPITNASHRSIVESSPAEFGV